MASKQKASNLIAGSPAQPQQKQGLYQDSGATPQKRSSHQLQEATQALTQKIKQH